MNILHLLTALLLLLAEACGSGAPQPTVESGSPVIPATPKIDSQSTTPLPSAVDTLTPQSPKPDQLATARASLTQVALSQARLTSRAMTATASAPTSTPSPTPELGSILSALEDVREPEDVWTSTSPDGKWVFQGINQICAEIEVGSFFYYLLDVSRAAGSAEWVIFEEYSKCGVGYPIYEPVGWSSEGQYFYYAERIVPDGCPAFFGGTVFRVDLIDKIVDQIQNAVDWSTSPDQTRLALTSGQEVVLRDASDGELSRVPVQAPEPVLAGIVWSPDSKSLIVTALEHDCGFITRASIVRLELPDLTQTLLTESGEYTTAFGFISAAEWSETAGVQVHDLNGEAWWLDPATGKVTPQE